MSRAFFSLLHLDLSAAFRYHPLIYPVLLFVPYYFLGSEKNSPQEKSEENSFDFTGNSCDSPVDFPNFS